MRYKVWNPDVEAEEDAEVINAHSPGEAGEIYIAGFVGVHTDSFDLMVADEDGVQYEVTVDIDFTPSYTSWAKKMDATIKPNGDVVMGGKVVGKKG